MAAFQIGSQNAASIQNVEGDLTIGELHIEASWSAADVRRELAVLEEEIRRIPLPHPSRVAVDGALAATAAEVAGPAPDRGRIAQLVQRAAHVLDEAGVLTTAGTGLGASLRRTATLLGPAGKAIVSLLPLL